METEYNPPKALAAAKDIEKDVNTSLPPDIGIDGLEPLAVGIGITGTSFDRSIGPAHRRAHAMRGDVSDSPYSEMTAI